MSQKAQPGCLFLFGVPFAGVGVLMMYLTFDALSSWREAKSWVEVPASLQSVNLNTYTDDDGTTYQVEANYTYRFDDETYSGSRVGVFSGADNIGDYHESLYARLKKSKDWDEQVSCYVNPDQPTEAYLDREMRWGMIVFYLVFLFAFGGVGFGMMGVMGYQLFKQLQVGRIFAAVSAVALAAAEAVSSKDGENVENVEKARRPTRKKAGVAAYTVQTAGGRKIIVRTVFTLVWNLMALPVTWVIWPRLRDAFSGSVSGGDLVTMLFLIVPVIGVLFAFSTTRDLIHWRKFGISTLSFEKTPEAGGIWSCILTNSAVLRFDRGFRVELKRPAKHREKDELDVLAETEVHPQRQGGTGLFLPFQIMSPPSNNPHFTLVITADIPGLDYRAEFNVKAG